MQQIYFGYYFDRREVYRILQEEGIDLPRYAVLNRDPDKPDGQCAILIKNESLCIYVFIHIPY